MPADVCLLSMPYAAIERPSLALGVLKASLAGTGISCQVLYPSLWFAGQIGLDAYGRIAYGVSAEVLLGEWTFSGAAFPDFQPDHELYFSHLFAGPLSSLAAYGIPMQDLKDFLWQIRNRAADFVDLVAQSVLDCKPRIVGCTSTFQQHCASLALLRRIRDLNPDVILLIGGANCEGAMGVATQRAFPWLDFVFSGEADLAFPQLCQSLLAGGTKPGANGLPYGLLGRFPSSLPVVGGQNHAPRAVAADMDAVPIPDYDDYFKELAGSPLTGQIRPGLVVETSRGCWWGQKHHCTFCGLNGQSMTYRLKSSARVLRELETLAQRYRISKFDVADNILGTSYFKTVFPQLAAAGAPYSIFYETKANLSYQQVSQLAAAGIRWIQPGIESFDDSILSRLEKGNSTLQNVQLLKWARELGIQVSYYLLCGLPGEDDAPYVRMAEWLPLIAHLQPPLTLVRISYDRFSPYYERPAAFGIRLLPRKSYQFFYPLPPALLQDLAYFFEDYEDEQRGNRARPALQALNQQIGHWRRLFWQQNQEDSFPFLSALDQGDHVIVVDTRPCAVDKLHVLEGLAASVCRLCHVALSYVALLHKLQSLGPAEVSVREVESVVRDLCDRKILLNHQGHLLTLAIRGKPAPLPQEEDYPGGFVEMVPGQSPVLSDWVSA